MKRAFSIFLVFVFLLSTTGFAVNVHYCPVKNKTTFGSHASHNASCCGKRKCSMPDNCCKHETKYFKLKTDFSSNASFSFPESKDLICPLRMDKRHSSFTFDEQYFIFHINDEPPELPVSRCILFRSILI